MTKDFVLEIGVEELPARYCQSIIKQLSIKPSPERKETLLEDLMFSNNLKSSSVNLWITPRRIIIFAKDLELGKTVVDVKGPLKAVAFSDDGQPNDIAEKFANSQGVSPKDLIVKEVGGKEFVFVQKDLSNELPNQVQKFLQDVIKSLNFEKTMIWEESGFRFGRPIRWLLCLYGGQVLPVKLAGLTASNITYGPRFLLSREEKVASADKYLEVMKKLEVIVDQDERKADIAKQMNKALTSLGTKCVVSPDPEEALLKENTFLVENPFVTICEFAPEYLSLPGEVVWAAISKHLRGFTVLEEGKLFGKFIIVANFDHDSSHIRAGYEEVVNSRLRDALFFLNHDLEHKLEDFIEKTKLITFQEKLGSMADKALRLEKISLDVAKKLGTDTNVAITAAKVSKADLGTQMVTEFPSLQGIVGRIYYALQHQNEKNYAEIARAIEEAYLPRFSGDTLPTTSEGTILSLADKMDTIYGLFSVGIKPKGSSDPYGLRRSAIGIMRILWELEVPITLDDLIDIVASIYKTKANPEEIKDFLYSRLEQYLKDTVKVDLPTNIMRMIIYSQDSSIFAKKKRVIELVKLKDSPDLVNFLDLVKRVFNIAIKSGEDRDVNVNEVSLNKSEKALWGAANKLIEQKNTIEIVQLFTLISIAEMFFNENMVMSENKVERERRLAILARVFDLISFFINPKYIFS